MNEDIEQQIARFIAAGNEVVGRPSRVTGVFSLTYGKSNGSKIIFGNGCILNNFSLNLEQGNGLLDIGSSTYIRGRYYIGSDSKIIIGQKTVMNRHALFTAMEKANILIGDGCLFSDISISTTDWHSIISIETGERINPARDVKIDDSVWIGEGVIVQKGVTIGSGSIIGAKSIVTKPLPKNTLSVGIPAKVIKENVKWQRELISMEPLPVRVL
ncbi:MULTISPECIES: acyltransferase [Enterobacteriaceae]|uniref:acyltransferase n=1 Tax=Enterobacteriaceae TaxID=543 RepID=UPI0015DCD2D9|nr:acyltransferase [Klebsiella sp. WP8-S18-ESBL-06]BBT72533.1 hypothetical protein WP8S18E06_38320 [Klebsiella sp. WP8-S18-ESBL-06]